MNSKISNQLKGYRGLNGPSWRWRLAVQTALSSCDLPDFSDDIAKQAKSFAEMHMGEEGETRAAQHYREIAAAKSFWDDANLRQQFTILTLADLPREQIAKRLAVPLETVTTTELLFFDIRESRQAEGWINCHVILPEEKSGAYEFAVKCRAAYWGGPLVGKSILDADERVSLDKVQRIADLERRLSMKAQAALAVPLDDAQAALQYTKFYIDYDHKKRRLELEKKKFRHRCEEDLRKHELAERRIDASAKRAEAKDKAMRQRTERWLARERENENVAKMQEDARLDALAGQQRAANDRAAGSPLSKLTWTSVNTAPASEPKETKKQAAAQVAA
jgi:hypothetical protein